MRIDLLLTGCLMLAVSAGSAHAQSAGTTTYVPADYEAFNPRTALDIVERTPGFVLVEQDSGVRGLAGAGSNVLIDGARPSSKSGGIRETLRGIAADQIERVELLRNANLADAQGQTLVLNIVRRRGGTSGTWSAGLERNGRGTVYPRLAATASREIEGWDTSVQFNGFWEEYPFETERVFSDPDGVLTSSQRVFLPSTLTDVFLSGEAVRPAWGGALKLTGRFGRSFYYFDQTSDRFEGRLPDDSPDQLELLSLDSVMWIAELGADYTRPLGRWSWTTIGLLNGQDNEAGQDQRTFDAAGVRLARTEVASTSRPLEAVARTRFTSPQDARLKGEFGGEIAYNRLVSAFALSINDVDTPVPASNVTVEEWRGEAFGAATYALTPRLNLETGLAAEVSRISVSGDADNSRDLSFLKPSLALAWRPTESLLLRAGVRTTVGQLDFGDFAASAELDEGQTQAGNPELEPSRTVRYALSMDYRGAGDFAANLELFHEDRSNVLEQVLLPSGAPGLANAGDAVYRGLKATATLPLNTVWSGSRLTLDTLFLDTDFADPVTGEHRVISGVSHPRVKAAFRRDVPGSPWSWGVDYTALARQTDYLLSEFTLYSDNAGWGGFVERRLGGGLLLQLKAQDVNGQETVRRRTLFARDRSGPITGFEDRVTRRGTFLTLTLSGRF